MSIIEGQQIEGRKMSLPSPKMEKNGRFQAQKHQMPQNQYIMPGKEVEKRRNQGKKHQRQQISPTMSELEGQPIEPTISEKEVKN